MSGIKAKPKKKTGIVWIKYLSVAACLALVIFAGVKSGMLSPAEHKTDSNDLYVAKSLPVLDGRFTGQSGEESDGNTQEQSAKTSVTLEETDAEKLLALIEPADGAEEYEPTAEADYAVSLGGDVGVVLIYIDGDSVYADRGEGALSAPCTADEIRDLLDACAGE